MNKCGKLSGDCEGIVKIKIYAAQGFKDKEYKE